VYETRSSENIVLSHAEYLANHKEPTEEYE
jgi:hypothetical protein